MKNVLVTGGKGQLGNCIKDVAKGLDHCNFIYVDVDELDITEPIAVNGFFKDNQITHCINCAAYTAVDTAELNRKLAKKVNAGGVKNLAEACSGNGAVLLHISTDFVFDGNTTGLYTEKDKENPLGVYGHTKLDGEKKVTQLLQEHFIIRTSWLYSEHGTNFFKTMLKLGATKDKLSVICDQIGTPTYGRDLAEVVINIVVEDSTAYGTYHYSNEGVASWYDFAKAIFDENNMDIKVLPITSEAYPTLAKRPKFSAMDKSKIKEKLKLEIPYWRDSLICCLTNYNNALQSLT